MLPVEPTLMSNNYLANPSATKLYVEHQSNLVHKDTPQLTLPHSLKSNTKQKQFSGAQGHLVMAPYRCCSSSLVRLWGTLQVIVVQQLLYQINMRHQHPPAAVPCQAESIERFPAQLKHRAYLHAEAKSAV